MLISEVLNLPEKTWTPKDDAVMATLTVVGPYTKDQYGFKQPIQLKDDSGVSSGIIVQTKFEDGLMAQSMISTKARWCCKWYSAHGKQFIVGYCMDKLQSQAATPAPQATQAPQPAAQRPFAQSQPQPRDYDAENKGKIRHGLVCAYISAGVDPNIETVNYWMDYIMTGQAPIPPGQTNYPDSQVPPWES